VLRAHGKRSFVALAIAAIGALTLGAFVGGSAHAERQGLIAYQRDPLGGISVVPAGGGPSERISVRHGSPWYFNTGEAPTWSPNGRWIAIVDERMVPKGHDCLTDDDYACPAEIYVVHPDGTGERRVTRSGDETTKPVWSPDSSRLAFNQKGVLFVVNRDGTGLRRLATSAPFRRGYVESWSPDGRSLAVTGVSGQGTLDIYLVAVDGRVRRLTRGGNSFGAAWSPDGRWIAFHRDVGSETRLFVMRSDGTGQRILVDRGETYSLAWSPDSRQIAFENQAVLDDSLVFTVDLASGRRRLLTPKRHSTWREPSWSPDGTRVVVTRDKENTVKEELWIVDADGARQTRLLIGGDSAVWQPRPR
jgi:Tol biopolymer transport system component